MPARGKNAMAGVTEGFGGSDQEVEGTALRNAALVEQSRCGGDLGGVRDMLGAIRGWRHACPGEKISREAARLAEPQREADGSNGYITRQQVGTRELAPQARPDVLETFAFERQVVAQSPRAGSK